MGCCCCSWISGVSTFIDFEKKHFPQILNPMNWFGAKDGFSFWLLKPREGYITLNEGGYPMNFTARWKEGKEDHGGRKPMVILLFFGVRMGWFK